MKTSCHPAKNINKTPGLIMTALPMGLLLTGYNFFAFLSTLTFSISVGSENHFTLSDKNNAKIA